MPDLNDFHAFNSTKGSSDGGNGSGGGGIGGPAWLVIGIVVFMLIYFIASGASWDAIDTLLGLGFIVFLVVKSW